MKKEIFTTVICICILIGIAACSTSKAKLDKQDKKTATPLTYVSNFNGEKYNSNAIETEEGVTIICTSNYVLGPEARGQFLFALREWSEECLEDDYDWNVKFVSNGNIYQTDFYDDKGKCIATEKCNGSVTVDEYYEDTGTYVDKIILYIEYEDEFFSAEFVRSGN